MNRRRPNRTQATSALSNLHDYGIFMQSREIFLCSSADEDNGIDHKVAATFIKNLKLLESVNSDPITIHQYSIGGDQGAGFAIYDAIKNSDCKFIYICYGYAASMGSIIPQAVVGKGIRVTQPNCEWTIHEGSACFDGTTKQVISNAEALKRSRNMMYEIYNRACKGGSFFRGKTLEEIKNVIKRRLNAKEDWIIYGDEAVKYGFADGVYGKGKYKSVEHIKDRIE
mgnify:CR=1 FL=1